MMLPVLKIDDTDDTPAAHDGNGEKRFIAIFRKLVKKLEAGILRSIFWNRDGLKMFRDPSCDSLPHAELQAIDNIRMGILGGAQNEIVSFENINQARVALHQSGSKLDDAAKNFVKSVGSVEANADFMEYIYV
jgi:hypothetical protein